MRRRQRCRAQPSSAQPSPAVPGRARKGSPGRSGSRAAEGRPDRAAQRRAWGAPQRSWLRRCGGQAGPRSYRGRTAAPVPAAGPRGDGAGQGTARVPPAAGMRHPGAGQGARPPSCGNKPAALPQHPGRQGWGGSGSCSSLGGPARG